MPVQQRHAHLGRDGDRFGRAVRRRRVRVEDGLAALAGRQVDEKGPGGAGGHGYGGRFEGGSGRVGFGV